MQEIHLTIEGLPEINIRTDSVSVKPEGSDNNDNTGTNGKSAYEIAVDNGFEGTVEEWLESLKGEPGEDGTDGAPGVDGPPGTDGKSAYQIAVDNGFDGTEVEWLESLKGEPGEDGTSITGARINENGNLLITYSTGEVVNVGTVVGEDNSGASGGGTGADGKDGTGIQSITINSNGELVVSLTDGTVSNLGRIVGADGQPGDKGDPGDSAYEVAIKNGFRGTEQEWLASLKGEPGIQGEPGQDGQPGADGAPGTDGEKGETGVGISSVEQTVTSEASGGVNVVTVTKTDGSSTTFEVRNGAQGEQGPKGDTGEQGPEGPQGVTGERGAPFSVAKIYTSVAEMNAGYSVDEVLPGEFVVIDTGNVEDEDNAKLYIKGDTAYRYITDMSGAQGMQGPQGIQGIQGIQGPQGDKGTSGSAGIYIRDPDTETVEEALANAEAAGAVIFIDPEEEPEPEYATTAAMQQYVDNRVGWVPLWLPTDDLPRLEKGATVSIENLYNYRFIAVTLADAINPCILEIKGNTAAGGGMYLQESSNNIVIRGISCTCTNDSLTYDLSYIFNAKNTTHASSSAALSAIYGIRTGGAF